MSTANGLEPAIALIVSRIGPYHAARMRVLAESLAPERVVAIEVAGGTQEYLWDRVPVAGFEKCTLYPHQEYERLSGREKSRAMEAALDRLYPKCVAINGWGFAEARAAIAWCNRNRRLAILLSDSQERDARRFWPKEWVKHRIVSRCDAAVVAGTRHVEYLSTLGMARSRIVTGYDVVDNDHFSDGADEARRDASRVRVRFGLPAHYFLTSVRLVERKGVGVLIDAFRLFRSHGPPSDWKLVVMGDGPLRPKLERRVAAAGLESSVIWLGFRQYDELPAVYGLASAFVLPSLVDQWGLVANEAMAAAIPIIVSEAAGCAPDLVEEGGNGHRVPPGDARALAEAMRKLATNDGREAMGTRSKELIANWGLGRFSAAIIEARSLAERHRGYERWLPARDHADWMLRGPPLSPRVALVTNMIPPYRVQMLKAIHDRLGERFRVVCLAETEKNRTWSPTQIPGIGVDTVPGRHIFFGRRDWAVHLSWGVSKALRRHRPEVVIIGGWDNPASWTALVTAKAIGAKVVLWSGSHHYSARSRSGLIRFLKSLFVKSVDGYFAYGRRAAEYLVSLGAPPSKITVGSNAVESKAFRVRRQPSHGGPAVAPRGTCVELLYSGQIIARKGLGLLLEAVDRSGCDVRLTIVGDGHDRARLEEEAVEKLGDRVRFVGARDYAQMLETYAYSDVLVMPSMVEVWGLVANEAMAAGLPVIVSSSSGIAGDLVVDGETGLIFAAGDVESLTECIRRLAASSSLRHEIGVRAREAALRKDASKYGRDMLLAAVRTLGQEAAIP